MSMRSSPSSVRPHGSRSGSNEFLLAFGCCADQHQHAFGGFFRSSLQVDPIRPHVTDIGADGYLLDAGHPVYRAK